MKTAADTLTLAVSFALSLAFGVVCFVTAAFDACYSRKWDRRAGVVRK